MKALVKAYAKTGIWMEEHPIPSYGPQDLLVKVEKTAICGTDIHIYTWDEWAKDNIPIPLIIGHEFSGRIVAIGDQVKGFTIGQHVSGEGHITCKECRNCRSGQEYLCPNTIGIGINRQGCFAEYISIPAHNAIILPANLTLTTAAILDPLGNATHCALTFDAVGENVLITGAGPIGIMAAMIMQHIGAKTVVITDINPYRLKLAQKAGITNVINVKSTSLKEAMKDLKCLNFDIGLEISGNIKALNEMIALTAHGGKIAILGIPPKESTIDWTQIIFKGLTIKGIYGRKMFETWYKMLAMLESGLNISPVITHQFAVEEYQQAFETMASGTSGKIILNWD